MKAEEEILFEDTSKFCHTTGQWCLYWE